MPKQPASRTNRRPGSLDALQNWLPVFCRAVVVFVVTIPALGKFIQYTHWVAQFDSGGILWPELAVPVTAVLQICAILSLLSGIAGRVGAGVLSVVMFVAMVTAGPDPMNGAVFGPSVAVVVLGTGPYSWWDPQFSDLFEHIPGTGPLSS
jgi:uncharacterized membrane protein YphA (DoxX/SURF4 family)